MSPRTSASSSRTSPSTCSAEPRRSPSTSSTTIVDGAGKKVDIEARIKQIKAQIEDTTSDYDKEKLQERLAKLAGGVASSRSAALTEVEVKERKDRVDDALHATVRGRRGRYGARRRRRLAQGDQGARCSRRPITMIRRPASPSCVRRCRRLRGRSSPTPVRMARLSSASPRERHVRVWLQCAVGHLWRSRLTGRDRPRQGRALRAAGCCFRRRTSDYDRGDGGGAAQEAERAPGDAWWWHGWNGLLRPASRVKNGKMRLGKRMLELDASASVGQSGSGRLSSSLSTPSGRRTFGRLFAVRCVHGATAPFAFIEDSRAGPGHRRHRARAAAGAWTNTLRVIAASRSTEKCIQADRQDSSGSAAHVGRRPGRRGRAPKTFGPLHHAAECVSYL